MSSSTLGSIDLAQRNRTLCLRRQCACSLLKFTFRPAHQPGRLDCATSLPSSPPVREPVTARSSVNTLGHAVTAKLALAERALLVDAAGYAPVARWADSDEQWELERRSRLSVTSIAAQRHAGGHQAIHLTVAATKANVISLSLDGESQRPSNPSWTYDEAARCHGQGRRRWCTHFETPTSPDHLRRYTHATPAELGCGGRLPHPARQSGRASQPTLIKLYDELDYATSKATTCKFGQPISGRRTDGDCRLKWTRSTRWLRSVQLFGTARRSRAD